PCCACAGVCSGVRRLDTKDEKEVDISGTWAWCDWPRSTLLASLLLPRCRALPCNIIAVRHRSVSRRRQQQQQQQQRQPASLACRMASSRTASSCRESGGGCTSCGLSIGFGGRRRKRRLPST
ncbi:unnamed protein product, partial [Ectocarpus sp. 8 AP-2014]